MGRKEGSGKEGKGDGRTDGRNGTQDARRRRDGMEELGRA